MTIPGGYILQPRCIDNSDIMHEPPVVRELWFYLLRRVNHKDNGKYKRGMAFFNLGEIQEALHWYVGYRKMKYSKPQLTKSLRKLCERNMIETTKATHGIYITICKYDYYQTPKNYESNNEGNAKETRRKQDGHTKNKNVKNEKNDKYTDAFQHLWEFYKNNSQPNSPIGEKKKAFQKYSALVKEFSDDIILKHVEAYLNECKRTDTKTKHLVTFLNQHDFSEPIEKPREKTWEEMTPDERDDAYIAMAVKQGRG